MIYVYYYASSAFFNSVFAMVLVYYVFLRNKKNPLNQSFLYFGTAVAGWSLILSFWSLAQNAQLDERFNRCHMMFAALIPATFFHFVTNFTNQYERFKNRVMLVYAVGFFYSACVFTPLMITGVKKAMYFDFWPKPGPLLLSHVVYFGVVVIGGFILLIRKLFATSGADHRQTLLVLLAFVIGFGGGATNWFLWFDIQVAPLMNFFVGVMFAIIAYAMVRHGLMDLDAVVEVMRSSRLSMLGLISSSINHELRNPLYIAKGKIESHLDAVERNLFPSEEEKARNSDAVLKSALGQLERAFDIMQRFSKLTQAAKPARDQQRVKLSEICEDVLGLIGNEIEVNKIKIDTIGLGDAGLVANRRELEEIFFNLIMNACQAMGTTGGEIRLRAYSEKGKLILEISDTGPGIPKEYQNRIFDPFVTTKLEKGTGLGLYIVKQLVEKNGGKITVKSKIGYGTVFVMGFAC